MADEKKYYIMAMKIQNGEYRYDYKYLIMARNIEEAERIAQDHASTFYGNGEKAEGLDDTYYFHGGAVATQIQRVDEIDLATFIMAHLTVYTLGGFVPRQQVTIGY